MLLSKPFLLRLRSVSRVLSRTPNLESCYQTVNQTMNLTSSKLPLTTLWKVVSQETLSLNICGIDRHYTQPAPEHLLDLQCAKKYQKRDNGGRSRPRSSPQGPVGVHDIVSNILTIIKNVQQTERQEPSCPDNQCRLAERKWHLKVP